MARTLNIRLPAKEAALLAAYAKKHGLVGGVVNTRAEHRDNGGTQAKISLGLP